MADNEAGLAFLPVGLLSPTALRAPNPAASVIPPYVDLTINADNDNDGVEIDPKSGTITITNDDGSVDIDFAPQANHAERASKFTSNLADILGAGELGSIASKLIMDIQQDEMSRQGWLDDRAEGMRLLGLKLKDPRSSIDASSALEGMSSVDHPELLKAVLNFWANASGEMLPAHGPVKIDDKLKETLASNKLGEVLEEDLNYYLTTGAPEYYPDMSRGLLSVGFGGTIIRKVYNCPLRLRPVAETIDAANFIISNAATDLRGSGRYTHQITMRPSVLRRMQLAGAYRDVPITMPSGVVPNVVDQTVADMQGIQIVSQQTEDRDHTIYECYCELDIPGFEDKRGGKPTGLPLPYRVVMNKDSQQILEIRRNWDETDETKTAKVMFVVYTLIPGFGFYGIGLLNMLGNLTKALTAATRETLDSGMFANFPGFLFSKLLGRQNTNEFRVPPGGGVGLEHTGTDIRQAVMPLPYKDVSPAFVDFQKYLLEQADNLAGTTQVQVAEGRQDAPVGTTLAMLEQATKVEKATHKELWRAQSQEMILLKDCFRADPGAFVRAIKKRGATDWDEDAFVAALADASLVPQADPNTPSHMHRLMKAMGLIQLDKAYPGIMDPAAIVENVVTMLGFGDFNALKSKAPPGAGGIPPEMMLEMQKLADKSEDRKFKADFEVLKTRNAFMLAQQAAAQEERRLQAEASMQNRESQDQALQQNVDLRQSEMQLRGTEVEAHADVAVETTRAHAETLREKTEDTKGSHAVAAAKAKPVSKPTVKKPAT